MSSQRQCRSNHLHLHYYAAALAWAQQCTRCADRAWSTSVCQAACVPAALAGKDIIARASTGSGKTLAYLLPALQRVLGQPQPQQRAGWQALVLVPTRELCEQVRALQTYPAVCSAPCLSRTPVVEQAGRHRRMHAHAARTAGGSAWARMHGASKGLSDKRWRPICWKCCMQHREQVKDEVEAVAQRCGADIRVSALAGDSAAMQRDVLLRIGQLVVSTPGQVAQVGAGPCPCCPGCLPVHPEACVQDGSYMAYSPCPAARHVPYPSGRDVRDPCIALPDDA